LIFAEPRGEFSFDFNNHDPGPPVVTTASEERGILAGARILVVEDEFVIAMQIQSLLEEEGAYVVGPYHTLSEALKHIDGNDITAASLDLNLGRETAGPLASLLQQRHIPFVFYSVQTNDTALDKWRHVRLIQKPAASALIDAMAALVRRHAAETAG
jgi:DNA-binding response OmpR family regulator